MFDTSGLYWVMFGRLGTISLAVSSAVEDFVQICRCTPEIGSRGIRVDLQLESCGCMQVEE